MTTHSNPFIAQQIDLATATQAEINTACVKAAIWKKHALAEKDARTANILAEAVRILMKKTEKPEAVLRLINAAVQ